MIEGFVDEIERYQPKGPIHLIGYSIGGIYAFAMAELLLKRGREIGWLGMIDTSPVPYLPQWVKWLALSRMIIHRAKIEFTEIIPKFWTTTRGKPWGSRITEMLFRIPCNLIKLAKGMNSQYVNKKSKITQTIPKAEDYQNKHFVVITKKYLISAAQLRLTLFSGYSMYNWTSVYWKKFAKQGLKLKSIPIGHLDFFKPENVKVTADFINNDLKSVSRL